MMAETLGRSSQGVNVYCMQVETNIATYRAQMVAGSWIAGVVFISHATL